MQTRHEFLRTVLMTSLGGVLAACGTDGAGDSDPTPDAGGTPDMFAGTCATHTVTVGSNHGHRMTIAAADLDSTTPVSYDITGTASHPHTVTISPAQFATLKQTGFLMVNSTTDDGHPHSVRISCTT
ncbi:MAG: hypothetical protein ACKV2T_30670 [Kofleriaceae bacterium]